MTQLRTPKLPAALTPELVAKMRELYEANVTVVKIAAAIGEPSAAKGVGYVIRRLFGWTRKPIGGTKRGSTWPAERIEVLNSLRLAGKSNRQIAAALGVTRNAVIGQMHRHGLRKDASVEAVRADPLSVVSEVAAAPPLPPAAIPAPQIPIETCAVEVAFQGYASETACTPLAGSGGKNEPAPIADAVAKGSIGKSATPLSASMPAGQSVSPGFRVGASEGAHPPVGAGSGTIAPRVGDRPPREVPPLRLGPLKIADLRECHCRFIAGAVDGADTLYCGEVKSADSSYCSRHAEITGGRGTSSERSAMRYLSYVAHRGLA